MQSEDAVKQVQYVLNTTVDGADEEVAPKFAPAFRRVEAGGSATEVAELAHRICAEIRAGRNPKPATATGYAEELLNENRLLTDGSGK